MNAQSMAQRAYESQASVTRTPRSIEYQAIARITHQMRAAAVKGSDGFNDLVQAVHDNRRLWTLLASDVADEANGLAPQLKAQVFYLAEFTQSHSAKVLAKKASVAPLLEINAAILRGLRGDGA